MVAVSAAIDLKWVRAVDLIIHWVRERVLHAAQRVGMRTAVPLIERG
jgi:hypothetical protein